MGLFSSITKAVGGVLNSGVGDLLGAGLSYLGGSQAAATNVTSAREQMKFQQEMDNTKYRRMMADMRKAGLNPIMAAGNSPGSAPSGASASVADAITPAVSSANHFRRSRAEVANMLEINKNLREQNHNLRVQAENTQASTAKYASDISLNEQLARKSKADEALSYASAKNINTQQQISAYELPAYKNAADVEKSKLGEAMKWSDRVMQSIGNIFGNSAKSKR